MSAAGLTAEERAVSIAVGAGVTSGLQWQPRVYRDSSGRCIHCRAGTSAGAWRDGGPFVRLCGTCWRGAGGVAPYDLGERPDY